MLELPKEVHLLFYPAHWHSGEICPVIGVSAQTQRPEPGVPKTSSLEVLLSVSSTAHTQQMQLQASENLYLNQKETALSCKLSYKHNTDYSIYTFIQFSPKFTMSDLDWAQ